jgi:transmembrane sensor
VNRQIYEEASEWLVEVRVGVVDAAARERLDAWFRASPENIRAFLELADIWGEGGDPDLNRRHSTEELIARALEVTNVVALGAVSRRPDTPPPLESLRATEPSAGPQDFCAVVKPQLQTSGAAVKDLTLPLPRRRTPYRLAASAAFLALGLVSFVLYRHWAAVYSTGVGEQRTVQLSDGTSVELNARSQISVRFTEHERVIHLLAGQALFRVAKNPARPFVVDSNGTRVRAVGTQFDVYRKAASTTVTVLEGRVAVLATPDVAPSASDRSSRELSRSLPGPIETPEVTSTAELASSGAVLVSAGEQVIATRSRITRPAHADVAAATAWRQRELVFDSTPLAEVAAEFNRYNVKPLIVSDQQLNHFHVTGVFSSTDPASMLRFLRAQPEIRVDESDTGIHIAHR